eukprot:gene13996-16092_t
MSNSLKRNRFADDVPKVAPDQELLCMICTELVCDARQANCCGSIYCKTCIEQWLIGKVNGSCPSCRASLKMESLVVDKRTERQSAVHPRNCQNYLRGCSFVGGRKDVANHERICAYICKNPQCRALRAREIARDQQIANLKLDHNKQLLASAWQSSEQTLQKLYGLGYVKLDHVSSVRREYHYTFSIFGTEYDGYRCGIELNNYNVSAICSTCGEASQPQQNRALTFVLIHPSDPALNSEVTVNAVANRVGLRWCVANWMTTHEFEAFTKDGKFAFGIK